MAYKYQVEKMNEWGANPNSTKILGSGTDNIGFGTFMDMAITALNAQTVMVNSSSAAGALHPSATTGVYGTAFTVSAHSTATSTAAGAPAQQILSVTGLDPIQCNFNVLTIGAETLTFQVTATYSDGTTAVVNNKTATTVSSNSYNIADLVSLWANGKYITSLALAVKSSIGSSTSTTTGQVIANSFVANCQIPVLV